MPLDAARRHSTPVTTACHSTPLRATRCHFNWHGVAWSGTRGQVAWSGMEWHIQNDPGLHVPWKTVCELKVFVSLVFSGSGQPLLGRVGEDLNLWDSFQVVWQFEDTRWSKAKG